MALCVAVAACLAGASTIPPSTTQEETTTFTTTTTTGVDNTSQDSTSNTTASAAVSNVSTTTTAAAAAQPPFNCYDCNSGMALEGSWQFPGCSRNGDITNKPVLCSSFCFSAVGMFPAGDVIRGCGTALWFPPGQEPEEGCKDDPANNRHLCVCRSHTCNKHNLTELSGTFAQKYLDWKAKQEQKANAAAAINNVL